MKIRYALLLMTLFLWQGCIEKTPYYSDIGSYGDDSFSAGDTTYVLLNPVWDGSIGLLAPVEISIAQDGFIYIADSAAHSIIVVDQSGALQEGYSDLSGLAVSPIDVDIDKKMNVFFIDGTEKVYCWNQFWNVVGIDSVAVSATFINKADGTEINLAVEAPEWVDLVNNAEWSLSDITWEANSTIIDSLLAPHVFFDGSLPKNIFKDSFYDAKKSRFSGLTAFNKGENAIVVTDIGGQDSTSHRLMRIDFERYRLIKLSTGEMVWGHTGIFGQTLVEKGTGAGYANYPVAVAADDEGNLYYTQYGIQYGAHKVKPIVTGSYVTYRSMFTEGSNNIMDLHRFNHPTDIAVDNKKMIYVANKGDREIQIFDFKGDLFKKAGVDEVYIDSTYWLYTNVDSSFVDTTVWYYDGTDSILLDTTLWVFQANDSTRVDTSFIIEVRDQLVAPSAVAVDNRGVIYVCDTPTGQILRYRLSNVLDEDLQPNP